MSLEDARKLKNLPRAMETCPFCGKAFKRLKSHLPHCKLAGAKSDSNVPEQAKKSPKTRTKKALLVEVKEQYLKNAGDNMENTKKTPLISKKQKRQETSSFRTQKTMLEEKEKENFKKDIQNSHLYQAHGNSNLIGKDEHFPAYYPLKESPSLTNLQTPEVATSLVERGPVNVAVTQSQTSALQALPDCSKSSKAPEDLSWPKHIEDSEGAVEELGRAGFKSSLYKEVSKVKEDQVQEDRCSFGNDPKGSIAEQNIQNPEHQHVALPSASNSSSLLSSMVSPSNTPHSQFPRLIEHVEISDMSHQLQNQNSDILKNLFEGQLDLSETSLAVRAQLPRNCPLGLQWIPELQSNYIQLKIVPEQMDLLRYDGRMTKSMASGHAASECCKPMHGQLIPEVPLTSRRLMDVKISELPSWLLLQKLSVKTIPELGLRAWTQYYNKYINVRKGGIGGLSMILVGYCTLSYYWNYDHIRQDRWRKYH